MTPTNLLVGVISDTHGLLRPEALDALRGSDLIIHAGDVGQPELLEKLESFNLRQLRQRVELFIQIEPMSAAETKQYIEHRIRLANPLREVSFSDAAAALVHRISNGIPRVINILCDASLLVAYVAETNVVAAAHVRDAVRTVDAGQVSLRLAAKPRLRQWRRIAAIAAVQLTVPPPAGPPTVLWDVGGTAVVARAASGVVVLNLLPVVPLTLGSVLLMWGVSLMTARPGEGTIARYFQHP